MPVDGRETRCPRCGETVALEEIAGRTVALDREATMTSRDGPRTYRKSERTFELVKRQGLVGQAAHDDTCTRGRGDPTS
jgi:hypothetical protein